MTTAASQVEVNGLLLGPGTPYVITQFNPYNRSTRHTTTDLAWAAGSWSGREDTEAVAVPLRLAVDATDDETWLAAMDPLRVALAASSTDVELRWTIGTTEYLMYVRPRVVEPDTENIVRGRGQVDCALLALDPLIYSGVEHSQPLSLPSVTGGLAVPITVPITMTQTIVAGRAAVSNAGTASTGQIIRLDANGASLVEPRVTWLSGSTTSVIRYISTLDAGQWLEIDIVSKTALLNGTVSRRGLVSGDWPLLPPGTTEIAFDASTYSSVAQTTVTWRDAWK